MSRKRYQVEPVSLRDAIWERGHITAWELVKILAWKSAIAPAAASVETEDRVVAVTGAMVQHLLPLRDVDVAAVWQDRDRWEAAVELTRVAISRESGLRQLAGIRIATASAVLTILNPRLWPVIDRLALTAAGLSSAFGNVRDDFGVYRRYWEHLASQRAEAGERRTIHELDVDLQVQGRALRKAGGH